MKNKPIEHWKNMSSEDIIECINGVMCMEKWKDIAGYEGYYQVSDFGRIKRLATVVPSINRWGKTKGNRRKERIHKSHLSINGRPRVELSKMGIQKIFTVGRLVAVAFIPNKKKLPIVCHRDDDPTNNIKNNLFWGTQQDNIDDKCNKNRQARGERNGNVYLTEKQVFAIRNKYVNGQNGLAKLAQEFNTTATNIHWIVTRKNWKHI